MAMGRKAKIGLIQVDMQASDGYERRLDILTDMAEKCFEEGADLVFFPEAYQHVPDRTIVYRPDELRVLAAEWKERCADLARKHHGYVVPWDYEAAEDGRVYNSSYILDREGCEIGRFRKVHLTHSEISKGLSHGSDFPVFDLDIGRVGIMICFDNYFPESARILGIRGAELVLYPLYGDTLFPQWELKMRARAADNSMYVACCQIDNRFPVAYTGLVSPDGTVLHRLENKPSHLVAEVDLGRRVMTHTTGSEKYVEDIRDYLMRCRWPEAYGGLLEPTENPKSWEEIFCGLPPEIFTKDKYEQSLRK